jgi:Spy/CpxP family protein refolding chaperone
MLSRRLLVPLLAFSLALNFAAVLTLSLSWWKGNAQAADVTVGQKPMKRFLLEDLQLDRDRAAQVLEMFDAKHSRVGELRLLMNSTRAEMMGFLSDPNLGWSSVKDKLEAMNRIQGEIRYETFGTIFQIAESLSPEERKRFGTYLQERARACGAWGPGFGKGPCKDFKPER